MKLSDNFEKLADLASKHIGGVWSFVIALLIVILWATTGVYIYGPVITVATFLFVFLIQNSQNRSSKAIHIKLNEIILSINKARKDLMDIETLGDSALDEIQDTFKQIAEKERGNNPEA